MSFSDVSSATSHFSTAYEGFTTTTSATVEAAAATVPLNSVSGLTNGTVFVGVIEPGGAKEQVFTGTVNTAGSSITGVVWTKGTNVQHSTGVSVVDYDNGTHHNLMKKGILVHADQDGTLAAGAVDNAAVLASGVVTSTKLATDAVTTAKITDSNVTTAKLNNASVTADKLATGAQAAYTSNSGTTTSTSYTATLSSGGTNPSVTVTIGANGLALVSLYCAMSNTVADRLSSMTFVASGANTIAANDIYAVAYAIHAGGSAERQSATYLLTGLSTGSTTFTLNYKCSGDTSTFSDRRIAVVPL